jgi:nucleoporin POM152
MNGTPRLGSSYPSTPETAQHRSAARESPRDRSSSSKKILPGVPQDGISSGPDPPVIPLTLIDAPSQRFYVFAFYIGLFGWKLYDWGILVEDEAESFWLFLKWGLLDAAFLFGLPELRIPWLLWSSPVVMWIWVLHATFNALLMFRVPVSLVVSLWLAPPC